MTPKKRRKRQSWDAGDVFVIAIGEGLYATGQVVASEIEMLASVSVLLFAGAQTVDAWEAHQPSSKTVLAAVFATRDSLDWGPWKVVGRAPVILSDAARVNLEQARIRGGTIFGSANVEEFCRVALGLSPTRNFKDPLYLRKLLLPGVPLDFPPFSR